MNTVQLEWWSFFEAVMSPNAPQVQVSEMKKAFYAGSFSMLNMVVKIANEYPEDVAEKIIEGFREEFQAHLIEMDQNILNLAAD